MCRMFGSLDAVGHVGDPDQSVLIVFACIGLEHYSPRGDLFTALRCRWKSPPGSGSGLGLNLHRAAAWSHENGAAPSRLSL